MQASWFDDWARRHAIFFGLMSEADMLTLNSWREVFKIPCYTVQELAAASDFLAANPEALQNAGKYAGKMAAHLTAIQAFVRERRAVDYKRDADLHEHERGTCVTCGGTGLVVVPHLKGIEGGKWLAIKMARSGASFYTQAVLCHCPLGPWVAGHRLKSKPLLDLRTYSLVNPGWPEQMRSRRDEQLATAGLHQADEVFQKAMDGLLERIKTSEE